MLFRRLSSIWRLFRLLGLCLALILVLFPEVAFAHAEPASAAYSFEIQVEPIHHSDADRDVDSHCHPGMECSFQAMLLNGFHQNFGTVDWRLYFVSDAHSLIGRLEAFDPPPPRS